ncbi:MAG: tetratricopeptide repeat protein [Hyphomicrobiaceae bacterium]|nr:MAG: tetratricopeptide repeat protein [Hyphomicrobiaceae bacterium]
MRPPKNRWSHARRATYIDAATMRPGRLGFEGRNGGSATTMERYRRMESGWCRNQWRIKLLMAAAVVAVPLAAGALAQGIADQLAACKDEAGLAPDRITACTRVIELATDDEEMRGEAYLQRGVINETTGNREAAVKDYTEALKLDATNSIAYFNRGNAYDQLGEHDLAIADYTEAIKLEPSDPDIFNNRGQAYDNKGEFDKAIADYTESIRLNADNPRAFYNRGLAYANKGDHERAITDYGQAIKLEPRDAEAYASRGAAHEELGNDDAARADFRKALEIVPDHDDAKEGLERLGN